MAAGVSMAKIAAACDRDTKTVQHWADGGDPKDTDARIVLALYLKFCPEKYMENRKMFDVLSFDSKKHLEHPIKRTLLTSAYLFEYWAKKGVIPSYSGMIDELRLAASEIEGSSEPILEVELNG